MLRSLHKKVTHEDKYDREYACYWARGAKKIKRYNRKKFRRVMKVEMQKMK